MSEYVYGKTRDARILLSATQKQRRDLSRKLARKNSSSSIIAEIGKRKIKFSW